MTSVFRNLSLVSLIVFGLAACGDDDKASMSAPAESAATSVPAAAPAASDDSMGSSMDFEKAEGVIYQDEIYANWPYN